MMQHTLFWKRRIIFSLLTAFAMMGSPLVAADGDNDQIIRPYANGAGPAAIFRFGRQEDQKRDVFAVVDPTLWRIQFFTLADPDGRSFRERFNKRGDCSLPPTFRVWRVHQHEDRVVLQLQPTVPEGALIFSNNKPAPLTHRALSLRATAADVDQAAAGAATSNDTEPDKACSPVTDVGQLPLFSASDAAVQVTGGAKEVFAVSRTKPPQELGDFGRKTFKLDFEGRYLASAQELEHARAKGALIRHFLLTTRTEKPGFVATEVVLIRRSTSGEFDGTMRINLGLSRVKMGHRSVAISSTGEVLVMGTVDKQQFRVHVCAPFDKKSKDPRCNIIDEVKDTPPKPDTSEPVKGSPSPSPLPPPVSQVAARFWRQAFNYSEQPYVVDIGDLPANCRRLRTSKHTASCDIASAFPWTPPSDFRFARGTVTRKGVPYAQNGAGDARPLFTDKDKIGAQIRKPLHDVGVSPPFLFGDIENNDDTISSKEIVLFGIDCSAFVSQLWGLTTPSETDGLVNRANKGSDDEIRRLGRIEEARIGDAFVMSIKFDGTDTHLLNHIVLYQDDDHRSGPADSSRAILVVESSSSCGGVCWSFYDESFFHGWAIIMKRSKNRGSPKGLTPIPTSVSEWQNAFVTSKN